MDASFFCCTFAPDFEIINLKFEIINHKFDIMKIEDYIQLVTAAILSIGGLVMLFCGIYIDPLGQLHESLLIGFGEVATFAGALFGIDYTYKFKQRYGNTDTKEKPPNGEGG